MFIMFQSQDKNQPFLSAHITLQLERIMFLLGKHKKEHSLKQQQKQQQKIIHMFLVINAPEWI
nr:MAG TPA: hypothetical protein [Caudoviricetes sp.]